MCAYNVDYGINLFSYHTRKKNELKNFVIIEYIV